MEHLKKAPCCSFLHAHDEAVEAVRQVMPPEDTLLDLAEFFHIFGDSTRIKILYALSAHELCVCDIAALLGMTISAISHQLRILKGAKMVRCRRSGKTVFYNLADDHVHTILNQSLSHITEPC
jgi:ArsR family transcriptional regulator